MNETELSALFEQPTPPASPLPASPSTPAATVPPSPSPQSDPVAALSQQVQWLSQQVMQPRQQMTSDESKAPVTSTPAKDIDYFGPEEVQMLLDSKEPQKVLNRVLNSLRTEFRDEVSKRDKTLDEVKQTTQREREETQQRQQTEQYFSTVKTLAPELKDDEWLIQQGFQIILQDRGVAPWKYAGMGLAQIAQLNAELARTQKKQMLERWGGSGTPPEGISPPSPAAVVPARRAQLETGGSTRVGPTAQPKDKQQKALWSMIDAAKRR